jgi:hypothetical protein
VLELESCGKVPLCLRALATIRKLAGVPWHGRVCGVVQVKLNVPATSEAAPTSDTFVAVGIGVLVTEDWSSQGSLQLFRLEREKTLGFDGELVARWTFVDTYRREFTGPVTALSTSSGNLVVAFAHNVRPSDLNSAVRTTALVVVVPVVVSR